MMIAADKTTNYFNITKEKHHELLEKNITKEYKKANTEIIKNITKADKKIAEDLNLDDRVYSTSERQCFITLKEFPSL